MNNKMWNSPVFFYKFALFSTRLKKWGNMKPHMQLHTDTKPHRCTLCNKSYHYKGSLELHMHTHTGTLPFTCNHCGKGFSQKGVLNVCCNSFGWEMSFAPLYNWSEKFSCHYSYIFGFIPANGRTNAIFANTLQSEHRYFELIPWKSMVCWQYFPSIVRIAIAIHYDWFNDFYSMQVLI